MRQSPTPRTRILRHGLALFSFALVMTAAGAADDASAPAATDPATSAQTSPSPAAAASDPAPAAQTAPAAASEPAAAPETGAESPAATATPTPVASAPPGQIGTPPDEDADEPMPELPEIIITSQKFKQRLEDVPASVSQIGGDFINSTGKTNFQDLAEYLPNVDISLSHADSLFTIRGLSTQDTNPGFDPSVGTVIDGVFYGRGQFLAAFYMDIDHLEVLRGPQGTLFGKNATAGVFNLTTREPENKFKASAELFTSGLGDRSIRPALNVPLGEDWAVRFSANFNENPNGKQFNTFLKRPEGDEKVESMRLRLGYNAGHGLKMVLSGFQSRFGQNNNEFKFLYLTDAMRNLVRSYDPEISTNDPGDFKNSANFDSRKEAIIRGVSGTIETEVNGLFGVKEMTLSLIGGYAEAKTTRSDLDADFSPVPFIHDVVAEPKLYNQISQELRLNGQSPDLFGFGHGLNFVGGLYFASSQYNTSDIFVVEDLNAAYSYCSATKNFCDVDFGTPFPLTPPSPITNGAGQLLGGGGGVLQTPLDGLEQIAGPQTANVRLNQFNPTYGIFTQFEYYFTREIGLIAGLRYTYEQKTGSFHSFSDSQIVKAIAKQEDFDTTLKRVESDLAPKLGLKWKVNEDVDLYATWGKAFKSGGFNGFPLNSNNLDYEPEEATSYEFGIKAKADFLGGPVRISGAGYMTDFDNLQVSTFQGGNFIVLNAAKAKSIGGEMDFRWRPPVLGGFIITTSAGYSEATYKEYKNAPGIPDSDTCSPQLCVQDLTGKALPHAPRWSASFIPSYEVELTPNFFTAAAIEVLYRSSRFLDVDDDPRKLQKDTTMLNGHVTLGAASQLWAVTFGVQNLTNLVVYDQALNQPLAPGNISGVRTDNGRFYSANLSVSF